VNVPPGDKKGPDFGSVGGKPYHLELQGGFWEVVDGPGDLPPKPAAKPSESKAGEATGDAPKDPAKKEDLQLDAAIKHLKSIGGGTLLKASAK
jgi:hypothetical protein